VYANIGPLPAMVSFRSIQLRMIRGFKRQAVDRGPRLAVGDMHSPGAGNAGGGLLTADEADRQLVEGGA